MIIVVLSIDMSTFEEASGRNTRNVGRDFEASVKGNGIAFYAFNLVVPFVSGCIKLIGSAYQMPI